MKIVLVGAGSLQFGLGMLGDIFQSEILAGSEVTLHDINGEALKNVLQTTTSFVEEKGLNFSINASLDRKEAFKGADYIISSIEVGNRFKLWDDDWKVPMQYGIHQVYGENGGPGGVFHSLRIIPAILNIVKDALEICPDAWIFNFSNPMTAIVTTVKRKYPRAKFVGMCHEIGWLYKWLPRMLNKNIDDLYFKAAGLNHFSCMLELKDKKTGEDLYPQVLSKAHDFFKTEIGYSDFFETYLKTGVIESDEQFAKPSDNRKSRFEFADRKLGQFILENYNLLPITVDSHFGEYVSWAWDVVDHRGIMDFYDFYKVILTTDNAPEIKLELHERVVPIIEGIIRDEGYEEPAVNVLNDGLIEELPSWVAVEVPAVIDKKGVSGLKMAPLSKGYLSLLRNYCGVYDLTAEAILNESKNYALQALLANPVVHQATNLKEMLDRMIDIQSEWLGYLK